MAASVVQTKKKKKGFIEYQKIVVHKCEKCKKLTDQVCKEWILNVCLRFGGAESAYGVKCVKC